MPVHSTGSGITLLCSRYPNYLLRFFIDGYFRHPASNGLSRGRKCYHPLLSFIDDNRFILEHASIIGQVLANIFNRDFTNIWPDDDEEVFRKGGPTNRYDGNDKPCGDMLERIERLLHHD